MRPADATQTIRGRGAAWRGALLKNALIALLLAPTAALAYLDPGTGSLLLQGLIALVAGTVTTVGVYWRATVAFIQRLLGKRPPDKQDGESDAR